MGMSRYTSVSILISQKAEITELIYQKDWLGYRSVAEFVRSAIRKQLDHDKMQLSSQSKEGKADLY